MSSYMYSKTHSLMTRFGPSRTTTCTFHYEADAPWGRILTQTSLRNQPPNPTLPLSNRRTWSRYRRARQLLSRRTWDWNQHHRTRSWPDMHFDEAGNEPDTSTDTDDLPDVSIDRPLRVTFGNELRYAPTMAELIRCQRHRDGTLQSVPLPKFGSNTPYPSSLKGTHRRVHRHYQCKDLTSIAAWAATYREDPRTKHIYEVAIRSPAARHQLRDAKLSFDDGKFFHLSTMGKRVLVPRTLVTSIVAMYHESEFYGDSGVLRTMALIKRDYVCSHLRHYVERYILSCDVCQAAKSRRVDTVNRDACSGSVPSTVTPPSVEFFSGLFVLVVVFSSSRGRPPPGLRNCFLGHCRPFSALGAGPKPSLAVSTLISFRRVRP